MGVKEQWTNSYKETSYSQILHGVVLLHPAAEVESGHDAVMTYRENVTSQPIVLYYREWHPRTADLAETGSLLPRVVWSYCSAMIEDHFGDT